MSSNNQTELDEIEAALDALGTPTTKYELPPKLSAASVGEIDEIEQALDALQRPGIGLPAYLASDIRTVTQKRATEHQSNMNAGTDTLAPKPLFWQQVEHVGLSSMAKGALQAHIKTLIESQGSLSDQKGSLLDQATKGATIQSKRHGTSNDENTETGHLKGSASCAKQRGHSTADSQDSGRSLGSSLSSDSLGSSSAGPPTGSSSSDQLGPPNIKSKDLYTVLGKPALS